MALTVEMLVDQRPGVLSRVIRALRDLEQTLESNTLGEHLETDFKVLTISSSGPSKRIAEVIERLQQVTGVIELTAIQGEAIPRAGTAKEPLPFRLDSSAASLEETVERIVTVYPRMLKELQAYEEQVPVEQAESQLTNLGRLVGEALAHQDSGLNSYQELEPAIDELLLPKITPFSRSHREQRRVVVPVSVFNRRHLNSSEDLIFGTEAPGCYFMTGLIEGLLSGSTGHPAVRVTEARCRAHGDPTCEFSIDT